MNKRLWNDQYVNDTFCHPAISTMDIKQEFTTVCDAGHTNFTITDVTGLNIKVEPICAVRDEQDPLDTIITGEQTTNTKIKEEIIIEPESMVDENQPVLKRRKKIVKNWQKERTFALEEEALAAVKVEKTWARYSTNKSEKGNKIIYRCTNVKSKGQQCAAGVYLLYSNGHDATVTMYRSANSHTCDGIIEPKRCDVPQVIEASPHELDTNITNNCDEYIYGSAVNENGDVPWARKFNSKEEIDLAAAYDLDLKIVLRKFETTPILTPCDQMTICKSIVKCYLYEDHDRKFGIKDFIRMSKVIVQRFPGEVEETYYTKAKKQRARGKLYDQFQHFRGLLISVGLATKRRRNTGTNRETGRESDGDGESGSET